MIMYMYVRVIEFTSVSTIFLLDIRTVVVLFVVNFCYSMIA